MKIGELGWWNGLQRLASWVGGRDGSKLWRRTRSAEGLDRSWGGELGLWWRGLCRSAMEEKRETQREDGEENVRRYIAGMK
nr:hypothetical protein CFP56_71577 [Quercus suber]